MKKALIAALVFTTLLSFASCVGEVPEEGSDDVSAESSAFETESKNE